MWQMKSNKNQIIINVERGLVTDILKNYGQINGKKTVSFHSLLLCVTHSQQ